MSNRGLDYLHKHGGKLGPKCAGYSDSWRPFYCLHQGEKMFTISPFRSKAGIEFEGVFQMVAVEDGTNPRLEQDVTKLTYINVTKSINVDERFHVDDMNFTDENMDDMCNEIIDYRAFNASYSKLGAAVALGINNIHVRPGSRVLYIGSLTCAVELSHLSDIVGITGHAYVVGFDEIIETVPDLFGCLVRRPNITLLKNMTATDPSAYAQLTGQVDVIVSDVNDANQVENLAHNAQRRLFCLHQSL